MEPKMNPSPTEKQDTATSLATPNAGTPPTTVPSPTPSPSTSPATQPVPTPPADAPVPQPTMPANPTLHRKAEPTRAEQDALKAERDALLREIQANEREHRDLVAKRRQLDQQIRDNDLSSVADWALGPLPDLPPDTHAPAPEAPTAPKVSLFGHEITTTAAIYAILCLVAGGFIFPLFGSLAGSTLINIADGAFRSDNIVATVAFFVVACALMLALGIGFIVMGVRMILGLEEWRLRLCNWLIIDVTALFLCHITVFGVTNVLIIFGLMAALLVALHGYFDPEIALEKYNRVVDTKTLRQMLRRDDVERTYLPGKRPGKGYISLNFFNLFWIFTICSFLGLIIETIWHMTVVDPGVYQDRAGMLWGPLSPIYGFGGSLMTIFLNRLHNKPIWVTFIVSAIVGGAFEYFTSWYLQYAFGITAWNYSGTFLNIDGRTNFMFMCMWGVLGCVWVRLLLPVMLYFMKKIPWGWKYTLTTIFAVFVIFDGIMTTVTLDCWYLREDGVPVQGAVETFCAEHFDNQFMQDRFQSMTMNVSTAARSDANVPAKTDAATAKT